MLRKESETKATFLQKNARAKWTRIHFFGSYESSHDTNSIFLQAKNAQVRTNSNCGKLNVSKNGSPIFYKRKRYTKVLFNKNIFSKKWGQALCACVGPPGPHPFLEKHGTAVFETFSLPQFEFVRAWAFLAFKKIEFVSCELS